MERKNGGSSFADAVFRFNADPKNYAKVITKRIIQRKYGDHSSYGYYEEDKYFVITKNDKPLVCISFNLVEIKRCEHIHAFDHWIESIIGE